MAGQPCAVHPNETTFVRCGRCDKPICTRCMVDTPVGKKCRSCARNQTHLSESSPRQVLQGLIGALVVAVPGAWLAHQIPIFLLAFPYGWLVGETAFRCSQRSRSLAMQVVTGIAAFAGGLIGYMLPMPGLEDVPGVNWAVVALHNPMAWVFVVVGTLAAVSRVRYL
jgi:hypothetical protein